MPLSLAAGFPPATADHWLKRVESILKGASFEEKLVSKTADGIRIEPLYGQIAGPRADRARLAPWTVCQRVDHPGAAEASAQALDDLGSGATGLVLVEKGSPAAHGAGIDFRRIRQILDGVELHAIALRVEGSGAAARALAQLISTRPIDPSRLDVNWGESGAGLADELRAQGFAGPFFNADGRMWHERGATPAQELGAVLATCAGFLDRAEPQSISVTLAADQDMFGTLAKFRAMRLLWARLLEASGIRPAPLALHAETSFRMMASLDPHTNILRSVAAVFGAGLGGADSISVLPFSIAQGLPNGFARRVARNVQTVLLEESNLWRVADPASGAGYVETLTCGLCETAWGVFQKAMDDAWPAPDPSSPASLPVIGTGAYRLPTEYPPQVESLS
jgi:methylmalonyl-CoA mutase